MDRIELMKRTNKRYAGMVKNLEKDWGIVKSVNFSHVAKNLLNSMHLIHQIWGHKLNAEHYKRYLIQVKSLKRYLRLIRENEEFADAEISSIKGYFPKIMKLSEMKDGRKYYPYATYPEKYVEYAREHLMKSK